ncbi:prolyl oligopeptidase [Schizophyllum amplum]|uniref:Prolyl endopeptidase n=1 Tax=Schizophyllum amplum TaxID=97359 RepID=A0A550CV56_9AGAR|nr:prolyl oligopeptidase [Auriculariopsis ampla]
MPPTPWEAKTVRYPAARRSDHVDIYKSEKRGEVRVPDPYQWLEAHSPETDAWTTEQEAFARQYLDKNPDRDALQAAFTESYNYAKFSSPFRFTHTPNGRWYWWYNSGLQAQSVLYRSKDSTLPDFSSDKEPGEVFFDPNLLSEDGTVSIATYKASKCERYFAYALSYSGGDSSVIYVRSTDKPLAEVDGKKPSHNDDRLPEELRFVKFSSITWTHDSKGFFYQRYPDNSGLAASSEDAIATQADKDAMIYYHRIGTQQTEDVLVHSDKANPEWMFGMRISELDGRYLMMSTSKDTTRTNMLWIADLEKNEIGPQMNWIKLVNEFDGEFSYLGNDGTQFYLTTNHKAPLEKVVTVNIADEKPTFTDVIPHGYAQLSDVTMVGDHFVVVYTRDVKDELYVYSKEGKQLKRLAGDFVGAAGVVGYRNEPAFFVEMTGFNTPKTIGRYDFSEPEEEKRWSIFRSTSVRGINPEEFEATQVWYESKDGTKVPMFIVRHKSTPLDGTAAAIQYGYGGFSISINPFFSPMMMTFCQRYNAVLAVPNIRGGNEFGEEWHLAGTKERKVNVFDDFIAATEYLVKNKYAAPGKVAINGGSNGGLLVAACVNRAPEGTFGAAVAEVGVLDLLKFADFTIGKAWCGDYGDPHDPHDFDFIYPLSPLHNIPTDKVLPPTILLTADHDDRVVPMHSFKHAAEMQHLLPHNPHPLLLRVDKKSGHGAGKSTEKRIKEAADKWGFVAQSMGLEPKKI